MRALIVGLILLCPLIPTHAQYFDDDYQYHPSEYDDSLDFDSHRHKRKSLEKQERELREQRREEEETYMLQNMRNQAKILRELKKLNGTATKYDYYEPICTLSLGCN